MSFPIANRSSHFPRARRGPLRGLMAATVLGSLSFALVAFPAPFPGFDTGAAAARPVPESFADLAEQVTSAVVNVSTEISAATPRPRQEAPARPSPFGPFGQGPEGSPFQEFFERFFDAPGAPKMPQRGFPGGRMPTSLGSGFIIDPSGIVVTNNHVVANAAENGGRIEITLKDGETYDAEILGRDPKTDLAVLQAKADRALPTVRWGDSDGMRVGDWVMAVGNPFGLGGTVTAGIVSARSRNINAGPYDDFLQLDAAINRGNSGGPSFDMNGRVIGVNTAIFSPSGGNVGIGFAIPSNLARAVVEELRETGTVERGWLGVRIQEVTPDIADSLGLSEAYGALVAEVTDDGPADNAGLQAGDLITRFDGRKVEEMRALPRMVAETGPENGVEITILRDRRSRQLRVDLGRLPSDDLAAATPPSNKSDAAQPAGTSLVGTGLVIAPLDQRTADYFGIADASGGVVVTAVDDESAAAEKGFRPGDVITSINQRSVARPDDVVSIIEDARDAGRGTVLIHVARDGSQRFVLLSLSMS